MTERKRLPRWTTLKRRHRFESWLRQFQDDWVISVAAVPWACGCPIAEYCKAAGYEDVEVQATIHLTPAFREGYAVPGWMRHIIYRSDDAVDVDRDATITAGDIRQWLKEV